MAHLQEKGTFWGKVRSSTNKISSSIANLSLRSEHDGDSPNSTLVHTALVNHYIKRNEQFPQWLGEEQHEPHQKHQQHSVQSSATSHEQIRQPVPTQRFQPQQSHQQQGGTSRFASKFQQEQQRTNQSPQASNRFGSTDSGSAGSRFGGNGQGLPGGGPQRTDSASGSALKDRLKKNNYRSNFNV